MLWIAPSEKDTDNAALEKRLWDTADQFRPKKCEVRIPSSELLSVRQSKFAVRNLHRSTIEIRHSTFAIATSCIVRLLTEIIEPYHGRILETLRLANARRVTSRMNRAKPPCARGKRWPCASTSGGMFVSSARFVSEHKASPPSTRPAGHPSPSGRRGGDEGLAAQYSGVPSRELSIHGVEKTDELVRLCRLKLSFAN